MSRRRSPHLLIVSLLIALVALGVGGGCASRVEAPGFDPTQRQIIADRVGRLSLTVDDAVEWMRASLRGASEWPEEFDLAPREQALVRFVWMSCLLSEVRRDAEQVESTEDSASLREPNVGRGDTMALLIASPGPPGRELTDRPSIGMYAPCQAERMDEYVALSEGDSEAFGTWLVDRLVTVDGLRVNLMAIVPDRVKSFDATQVFLVDEVERVRAEYREELVVAESSKVTPDRARAWEARMDEALAELDERSAELAEVARVLARIGDARRTLIASVARRTASSRPGGEPLGPVFLDVDP